MLLEDVFRHIDEFEQFKSFCLSRECNRRKHTWFCRNIDDANMKDCERIDHSYTIIPEDFPQSVYSGKQGEFFRAVLNDKVISVPKGSESSFTFKAKNKHEESLFKIEDERYEIDQAISLNKDLIKVLEHTSMIIEENNGVYELDRKQFTRARMSWIYQLCTKNLKMIEYISEHPVQTIPVLLKTVKAFQADFIKKKEDMFNTWKAECTKHWQKSLDHKSFHFRANEKKNQVAKEFLIKMKLLMELSKTLKDERLQKEILMFYTGFEGQEIKSLNLKVNQRLDPDHHMLLKDPKYLEHFDKLPQFRFLINDEEILRITLKMLYC